MALSVTVTPGKTWASTNDPITITKLNQTANPTVVVTGNLNQISNVSNAGASNTQPLVFNTGTNKWEPGRAGVAYLGNGSPNAALFLRGDGNWADPTSSITNNGNNLYLNSNVF